MADSPSQDRDPRAPSSGVGPSTSEARGNSTIAGWSHPPTMDSEGDTREHSENTAATALDSQPGGADPEVSGFLDTVLPDGTPPPAGRGDPDPARFGSMRPDSLDLPAAPQPGKGDKIGRYTIEQRIGEGGMGVVYLAHDPELDRRVAIKSLRSDAWSTGDSALNTKMRQRLRREAQALAQLEHPHVVAVYDTGIHDGNLFVAMAYVEGQDLRGWLKANDERPLSAILDLFADAGEGLAAAHRAELIHRDFKPDNVLIDRAGRAQVADFGLARGLSDLDLEDEEDATPMPSLVATLTRTGALMGTPPYMAPELFRGERGDAQSDQFAYCVTLFEAVYGQRPFQGRNLDAISKAVLSGKMVEPDPSDRRTWRVPLALHRLILRGLSESPAQRFPDMDALLAELGRIREELRSRPQRRKQRRRRRRRVVAAVLVLAGASLALPPVRAEVAKIGPINELAAGYGLRIDPAPAPALLTARELLRPAEGDASGPAAPSAADEAWSAMARGDLAWAREAAASPEYDVQALSAELLLAQTMALLELGESDALAALLETHPDLAEHPAVQVAELRALDKPERALAKLAELRQQSAGEGELPWRLELAEAEQLIARASEGDARDPEAAAKDRAQARARLERVRQGPLPARAHELLALLAVHDEDLASAHGHLDAARRSIAVDLDPRYARLHADFLVEHGCRARATEALLELAKSDAARLPADPSTQGGRVSPPLLDTDDYRRLVELELLRLEDARFWGLPPEPDPAWPQWLERAAIEDEQVRDSLELRRFIAEGGARANADASTGGAAAEQEPLPEAIAAIVTRLSSAPNPLSVSAENLALLARLDHDAGRRERAAIRIDEAKRRGKGPRERARVLSVLGRMQATDGEVEAAAESFLEAWRLARMSKRPDLGWLIDLGELTVRYLRSQDKEGEAQQIAKTLTRLIPDHATTWTLYADGLREDPAKAKRAQTRADAASWCE